MTNTPGIVGVGIVHDSPTISHDLLSMPPRVVVDIRRIAKTLGHICRWRGSCSRFYSVAHHSVWVSDLLMRTNGPLAAMLGLLHDASEAFLCDIPRPLKVVCKFDTRPYQYVENSIQGEILNTLLPCLPGGFEVGEAVKDADDMALAVEAHELMRGLKLPGLPEQKDWPKKLPLRTDSDSGSTFLRRYKRLRAML